MCANLTIIVLAQCSEDKDFKTIVLYNARLGACCDSEKELASLYLSNVLRAWCKNHVLHTAHDYVHYVYLHCGVNGGPGTKN